jgi:hypothetical protein
MQLLPPTSQLIKLHLDTHFIKIVNDTVSRLDLPAVGVITNFKLDRPISEQEEFRIIAQFRFSVSDIGRRVPRVGYSRRHFCPLCDQREQLTEIHLFECSSLKAIRRLTEIEHFVNMCIFKGKSLSESFVLYINGFDTSGALIPVDTYRLRGKALISLVTSFLSMW